MVCKQPALRLSACAPLLALALGAGTTADQPPVPLRSPALETPIETAGTGLAPELAVRVHVDPRGRVDDVEIISIAPRSAFDDLFRKAARETLLLWRYAPAMREGQPVDTTLTWTIQFQPRQRAASDGIHSPGSLRVASPTEDSSQELLQRILSLPLEQRLELLKSLASNAARQLGPGQTSKFASPRVLVYTDAPKPEAAQTVAQNMESVFNVIRGLFGESVEVQPESQRIVVFLYASRTAFDRLKADVVKLEWADGFYHPAGLLAFHMEMPTDQSLLALMLHEATHAYVDRYVLRPGAPLPLWFGEGMAEYIGNSDVRDRQLVPGRTRRREVLRTPSLFESVRSRALYSVDELRGEIRQGNAPSLARLLTTPAREFYGDRPDVFYTMSWLAVHFLRHGDPAWASERFPRLVLYLAEGYPSTEVVRDLYGDPAALEEAFRKYVMRFR